MSKSQFQTITRLRKDNDRLRDIIGKKNRIIFELEGKLLGRRHKEVIINSDWELRELQELRKIEKKYQQVVLEMARMWNERNYYATFAAFGDCLHTEIEDDVKNRIAEGDLWPKRNIESQTKKEREVEKVDQATTVDDKDIKHPQVQHLGIGSRRGR